MKNKTIQKVKANRIKAKLKRNENPSTSKPRNPIKRKWLLEQKEKMNGYEIGKI